MASRRLPDFFLIGAMKSGTTTLWEYLNRHPGVFLCTPKEPQFFSRDSVYQRGLDWYASLFAEAGPEQLCGEASTCYTRWPHFGDVAGRIHEHVPDARFLYIMRNPVDRAYSHYRHLAEEMAAAGDPIPSFEDALEQIPEIIDTSLYARQIAVFLERFPRQRFLCLFLEDLRADPAKETRRVQEFLGLEIVDLTADGPVRSNPAGTALARHRARQAIDRLRGTPPLSWVADLLAPLLRGRVRRLLMATAETALLRSAAADRLEKATTPLRADARQRLLARFERPNLEIANLSGPVPASWSV